MVETRQFLHGCASRGSQVYGPIVGMVVTISPSLSLYRIVVFPAASRPTIKILISFLPHNLSNSFENVRPMVADADGDLGQGVRSRNVGAQ